MGAELALLSFALLLAHPVIVILFSWLGMPDGITFLLTVMLFFVRSYSWVALIGFLGALNHPIIYFSGPMILLLRRLSRESGVTYGHVILAFAGLSLGTLALQGFLGLHDIDVASRYHYIIARSFTTWLNHNLSLFPLAIFSLHNVVWLALGVCWISSFSRHRNYFLALLVYHIVAYVVTFFSLDTTRIFSLLAWAPALHAILYSLRLSERSGLAGQYLQVRKALQLIAFLGLLMPNYYMWNAKIRAPSFNEFYFSIIPQLRAWLTSLF